jgi:hypothetical protein
MWRKVDEPATTASLQEQDGVATAMPGKCKLSVTAFDRDAGEFTLGRPPQELNQVATRFGSARINN